MNELEIIRHRQIEGLSLFFDTVDYRTSHIHPEWELIWALDRPLSVTCGPNQWSIEQGQLALFSPNEPHEFHKLDGSCTFLCLQISASVLPGMPRLTVDGSRPQAWLSDRELRELKRRLAGIMAAYLRQEGYYGLYCVGQSCLILHRLLSRLPTHVLTPEEIVSLDKRNARLKRLICFVDENYMHKIRLADFAAAEGCSMSYLSRFIKTAMNQSFQSYVASVRFRCACKLMAEGNMGMLDVCMESGFSDYRYFSRAFRQAYGMTPEEFSRQARQIRQEAPADSRSLHSVEQFYSREESLNLLQQYLREFLLETEEK